MSPLGQSRSFRGIWGVTASPRSLRLRQVGTEPYPDLPGLGPNPEIEGPAGKPGPSRSGASTFAAAV